MSTTAGTTSSAISTTRAMTSGPIVSDRDGELLTWQCAHAWLQRSVTLTSSAVRSRPRNASPPCSASRRSKSFNEAPPAGRYTQRRARLPGSRRLRLRATPVRPVCLAEGPSAPADIAMFRYDVALMVRHSHSRQFIRQWTSDGAESWWRDEGVDRQAWAQKLAALKDSDWRSAFEVGLELADLPPDDGFAILKENWLKLKIESRQQFLKAWYYTLPYPLHARNHARIRDVLELGTHDRSPQVQQWARQFLSERPKAGKDAKPDDSQPGDSQPAEPDLPDVPAVDLHVGDDAKKRYLLIGAADKAPSDGYALLVVLPGGDGSEEFSPFVRNIYHNALSRRWLIAQVVAPKWDDHQFDQIVWPTAGLPYAAAKFTTEELVEAIVSDVQSRVKIDPKRVIMLGWSSGGPPCYAAALHPGTPVTGALVAMSMYKPQQLPPLQQAKGKAFYLLQSPDDRVVPIRFAETG